MADQEPQDQNQQPEDAAGGQPDDPRPGDSPEEAVDQAGETAGRAAEDIAASPETDAESEAALAAAMAAINQVKQGVDAASETPAKKSHGAKPPKPDTNGAASFNFQDLGATLSKGKKETLDLLSDVQLNVRIELGRTRMYVEDVLQLGDGAVVELDKLAGDPVDVFVNDRHVARGEVLVLNDNFCVRINEILDPGAETKA